MHATTKTTKQENQNAPAHDLGQVGGKATKAKEKSTMNKPATKKVSQAKQPPQIISEIHLIAMERIKIEAQVRTEFNEESIRELAADIEARGLRQPVEVSPIGDELYKLTLGERRFRAISLLGHKSIPAIIVKTSEETRLIDQLAENIQREDLSLKDLAAAVRTIYDKVGDLEATAECVKKSKAWVSKRLATTFEEFGWRAREALENGSCSDLEILNAMSQVEAIGDYAIVLAMANKIDEGTMDRQTARDWVKAVKEGRDPRFTKQEIDEQRKKQQESAAKKKAAREDHKKATAKEKKERTEGTGEAFIEWACLKISERLVDEYDESAETFVIALSQEQRDALQKHLDAIASKRREPFKNLARTLVPEYSDKSFKIPESGITYFEQMAIIAGTLDQKPDLFALIIAIENALKD